MEENEEIEEVGEVGQPILSNDDGRPFNIGMTVKIMDNVFKTATDIDIPDEWHALLFSVDTLYDDSVLIINVEENIYIRMYKNDLDIVEVND